MSLDEARMISLARRQLAGEGLAIFDAIVRAGLSTDAVC
jgi:hypothetical protein